MCRIGLLLAYVILCSLINLSECTHIAKGWTDPPGKIILERGTKLSIKCVVDSDEDISSQLIFKNRSAPIDPQYIRILNRTAIELFIPKVPEQDTMFVCYLGTNAITYNDIRVGRKPDKIEGIECTSRNWVNMTCTFPIPVNPVTVNYELKYGVQFSNQMILCVQSSPMNGYTFKCDIATESYRKAAPKFVFKLNSSNAFGSHEQTFELDNYANVIPDKPEKLTVLAINSDSVEISWNAPTKLAVFPANFDFEFRIKSSNECGEFETFYMKNQTSKDEKGRRTYVKRIPLKYSFTWYNIDIRMKITTAKDEPKMWSDWTIETIKTASRAPDHPPFVDVGAFNIHPNGDLYVYWKHLSVCEWNGENFGYVVKSNNKQNDSPYEFSNIYAVYRGDTINRMKDTEISIHSKNTDGVSREPSRIVIPGQTRILSAETKFNKKLINGTYYLSWTPPDLKDEIIKSYTVFWCQSKTELINQCESSIDFKRLLPSETSFEYNSSQTVNFAISVNSETSTTGMIWAKCTTANSYEIGKISTVRISHLTSFDITMEWSLDCTDSGIVAGYQIEYCPTNKPKTLECMEPEIKKNITTNEGTKYTLRGLTPYTTYKIVIRMFSNSTMGPPSEPLANTTLEAPPSPVQNLIARNVRNTTVDILWDPPLQFNGVLAVYEIFVNGSYKNSYNSSVRSCTIDGLIPYTDYRILIQACTSKCSEPISTQIRTTIGAPGRIEKQPTIENEDSNIFNKSYTSGRIQWNEPTYKGGNLDFYELKTEFRGNDDVTHESIVRLKAQKCFMEKLCVNNVTGSYKFSVRAVNFVFTPHAPINKTFQIIGSTGHRVNCENDELLRKSLINASIFDPYGYYLYGNWSDQFYYSCYYSSFDSKFTLFVLISLVASLIFVLMVFYLYRKIKDMKDILIQMPPGLEDLTSDKLKKTKEMNSDKSGKPDLLRNVDNQYITNEDEHGRLLRGSMNGSINGNDCSSSMHSESTRSEHENGDIIEDIRYMDFGQLNTINDNENYGIGTNQKFSLNTDTPITPILTSTEAMSASTPIADKCPKPNIPKSSNSGYVAPPSTHRNPVPNNNGYVTHSMMNPMQSNGYTQVNHAFGKPSLRNDFSDKFNTKTPIVATTDQEGISGYVTHKQLSDFGHRMQ